MHLYFFPYILQQLIYDVREKPFMYDYYYDYLCDSLVTVAECLNFNSIQLVHVVLLFSIAGRSFEIRRESEDLDCAFCDKNHQLLLMDKEAKSWATGRGNTQQHTLEQHSDIHQTLYVFD
jgi:hypothetical protein